MSEPTPEERRQQLHEELAQLEQQEREEETHRREQAEREAQLNPEQQARKAEIERRAEEALEREFPPAWLPQKHRDQPQRLVGLVLRIDPRVGPSQYGTYAAVIELRATDGSEWTLWANYGTDTQGRSYDSALYSQLVRQRIQPGEVVAVAYRGKKESLQNPGQSYHDVKLVRVEQEDMPASGVDYDALQRNRETPALPAPETAPAPDDDIPF